MENIGAVGGLFQRRLALSCRVFVLLSSLGFGRAAWTEALSAAAEGAAAGESLSGAAKAGESAEFTARIHEDWRRQEARLGDRLGTARSLRRLLERAEKTLAASAPRLAEPVRLNRETQIHSWRQQFEQKVRQDDLSA
ncbi:MAG TPA: hypothetical protein PLQ00_13915, partial [Thermoguttaceae bacterium]|nr:hypothetical protein [Thermoguttaceae bacterium]